MVAVHSRETPECLTAIVRDVEREAHHVHPVNNVRVDPHLTEYPAICAAEPLHVLVFFTYAAPRAAAVIRTEQSSTFDHWATRAAVRVGLAFGSRTRGLIVVDERVDDVGVRSRNIDTNAAAIPCLGKTVIDLLPIGARVSGLIDTASPVVRLVSWIVPLLAHSLPHRGI